MDLHDSKAYTRRDFIGAGLTLASAAVTVPMFLQRSAYGLPMPELGASSMPGVPEDHILVVVQLAGGNDGLNTVIPFQDDTYHKARPGIGIGDANVLKLGREPVALHPAMEGIKDLYDNGLATVVQGVGYPNPNRSHFTSMDIWHTGDTSAVGNGWLGRYFDNACCGTDPKGQKVPNPMAGIAIGREAPLAMQGRLTKPIGFENTDLFRWTGEDVHSALEDPYHNITRAGEVDEVDPGSTAAFLMRTALDAQVSSDKIRKAVAQQPLVQYPRNALGQQLAMVAAMIRAKLPTRVYYVSLGGFDTHAGQGGVNGQHANLLRTFGSCVKAFQDELKAQQDHERVLTMSFSEFGRRVYQNASGGTDHGAAAPMFLFGPMVDAGVLGRHPSLKDLDSGDLKYNIDFRSVYSAVLQQWLGADPKAILKGSYRPAKVLA